MNNDRRAFLQQMSALGAALASASSVSCRREQALAPKHAGPRSAKIFNTAQMATLEALVARIVPTDEDPGAREAGCATFIDAQMAQPQFKMLAGLLRRGLIWLDGMARKQGASFASSSTQVQDDLLGKLAGLRQRGLDGRRLMHLLVVLTLEGFLSDPRHGGNRDQVGWRFVGFEPVRWAPEPALAGGERS